MPIQTERVVLFDGVCNYCNAMVNFAIRNDSKARLKFASLQSGFGQRMKKKFQIDPEADSVIFLDNNRIYFYSTAALRITKYLDWPARLLYALLMIPRFIRDPIYKWFAGNRYKWFGKRESCMRPGEDVRIRFLE